MVNFSRSRKMLLLDKIITVKRNRKMLRTTLKTVINRKNRSSSMPKSFEDNGISIFNYIFDDLTYFGMVTEYHDELA